MEAYIVSSLYPDQPLAPDFLGYSAVGRSWEFAIFSGAVVGGNIGRFPPCSLAPPLVIMCGLMLMLEIFLDCIAWYHRIRVSKWFRACTLLLLALQLLLFGMFVQSIAVETCHILDEVLITYFALIVAPFVMFAICTRVQHDGHRTARHRIPLHDRPGVTSRRIRRLLHCNGELCAICLGEYKLRQRRITLPCLHGFHERCISAWIDDANRDTCPLCACTIPT